MRIARLIVLAGALALPTFSGGIWAAELQSERGVLEECGAYPEAGMRECLVKKSHESTTALKRAEEQAIVALSKWDEDAKYISLAKGKLSASCKAYEHYRDAQCAFTSSLGGGAIGNALELRRLACLVGLNNGRTQQLNTGAAAVPKK